MNVYRVCCQKYGMSLYCQTVSVQTTDDQSESMNFAQTVSCTSTSGSMFLNQTFSLNERLCLKIDFTYFFSIEQNIS